MAFDSSIPPNHLPSIFLSFKIPRKLMVMDKMLLWLEVLSIRFPAQLMETLFPVSHGIVKVLENSSKRDKVGATFV